MKMKHLERIAHDMRQYAFTKRKLNCSIKMGDFLEKAVFLRKWGIIIWYLCGPLYIFAIFNKLLRELRSIPDETQ